ncbi:MAG: hypothetical protein AAGA85_19260, partial [Bacteroidota bacterium]
RAWGALQARWYRIDKGGRQAAWRRAEEVDRTGYRRGSGSQVKVIVHATRCMCVCKALHV